MNALAWHITMRLAADRTIAASPCALRRAARILVARGRAVELLAFCVADNHIHVILACSREAAGRYARVAEQSMQLAIAPAARFERARFLPIQGTSHLSHALPYVLRQSLHHGSAHDPGFDGCSILDMFGLRVIDPELPHRVQRYLPRLTRLAAAPWFPPLRPIEPDLSRIADAAAAAVAAADLRGNTPAVAAARRAAVQVAAADSGIDDAAALLGITVPAARKLRARPSNPLLIRAIRGQLALRTWRADGEDGALQAEPPSGPRSEVPQSRLHSRTSDRLPRPK